MIKRQFDLILAKAELPETAEIELTPESIELLKEYGLLDESAADEEVPEADGEVGE